MSKLLKFPERLPDLADRVRAGLARVAQGETEWLGGTLEIAEALAAARGQFRADREFHSWLIGQNCQLKPDARAALIGMGQNLALARTVLETSHRRSWQWIWRAEIQPLLQESRSRHLTIPANQDDEPQTESEVQPDFALGIVDRFRPQFRRRDTFLDSCCGLVGGFINALPAPRFSCEIQCGSDFLAWTEHVAWCFSNPPWGDAYRAIAEHAFRVAVNVVFLGPIGVLLGTWAKTGDYRAAGHGLKEHFEVRWQHAFGCDGPSQGHTLIIAHWQRGWPDLLPLWQPNG